MPPFFMIYIYMAYIPYCQYIKTFKRQLLYEPLSFELSLINKFFSSLPFYRPGRNTPHNIFLSQYKYKQNRTHRENNICAYQIILPFIHTEKIVNSQSHRPFTGIIQIIQWHGKVIPNPHKVYTNMVTSAGLSRWMITLVKSWMGVHPSIIAASSISL